LSAPGTAAGTATSPVATVTTTIATTISTTASSTTTTVGALEASVDFEVDLFFLLGACLGGALGLANKVGILFLVLGERDGTLEGVLSAVVGLAGGLQLGDSGVLLLLLGKVLLEGQGVVLLLGLSLAAGATFPGLTFGGGSSGVSGRSGPSIDVGIRGRGGPSVDAGSRSTPVTSGSSRVAGPVVCSGLDSGICSSSLLYLELGVAFVTTPGLVDLLVRVGFTGLRVPVEGTASATELAPTTSATTTTTSVTTTFASFTTLEFLLALCLLRCRVPGCGLSSTTGVVLATTSGRTSSGFLGGATSSSGRSGGGLLLGYHSRGWRFNIIEKGERVFCCHRHFDGALLCCDQQERLLVGLGDVCNDDEEDSVALKFLRTGPREGVSRGHCGTVQLQKGI
jgi:hypothetical protein